MTDISKMDKAEVLAALYNRATGLGMGLFNPNINQTMTKDEAQKILDTGQTYFDYHNGRVMKIDLSKDELRTDLYNRDNGNEAAEAALSKLAQ